jgi:hypothetical protein
MKKMLISILLLSTIISCDKDKPGNLEYAETIEGGCFSEKGSSLKNDPFIKRETVTYSVTNDILDIFIGLMPLGLNIVLLSSRGSHLLIFKPSIWYV